MTVGIPGAGIGGLFYLLNALCMPVRELGRWAHGRSSPGTRRLVVRQFGLALGIVAGMWLTAWAISSLITVQPSLASYAGLQSSGGGSHQSFPRLLSYSALSAGLATLAFVVMSVHLLRLVVPARRSLRFSGQSPRLLVVVCALFLAPVICGQTADQLQRADAAFKSGDTKVAEQEYREVLNADSEQSHAVFRLAQIIEKRDSREAERLYRRYMALEPQDAWGYIALAELLGRQNRFREAIALYDSAVHLEPNETDAVDGRTRMVALQEGNRRNAPAVEPSFSISRDSDGNTRTRSAIGSDFGVAGDTRIGLSVGRTRVKDAISTGTLTDFMFTLRSKSSRVVQWDGALGAARLAQETIPAARFRFRAKAGNAARMDLRFNRTLLDATPLLISNRIVRNELMLRPEVAIGKRFRVRGTGGSGWLRGAGENNNRYTVGGGAAWSVLSANFTQVQYKNASRAGYFAPARIQTLDIGPYMEFETKRALVAVDFGGGAERFREHGAEFGAWRPALRGYGLVTFKLKPASEVRVEVEGYNSQAGPVAAPSSGWKYGSVSASFRWVP